jgi:hypothetical protein
MYGVTIESLIESPMVPQSLTHQVVEYRINLTKSTFTLIKPTIYPGPHDLVRHSLSRLELVHSNSEGSGELPSHYLPPEIFKNETCETFCKNVTQLLFDSVDLV